jgi:hypothetical protein
MYPPIHLLVFIYPFIASLGILGLVSLTLGFFAKQGRLLWSLVSLAVFAELTVYAFFFGDLGDIDLWWPVFSVLSAISVIAFLISFRSPERARYSLKALCITVLALCLITFVLFGLLPTWVPPH